VESTNSSIKRVIQKRSSLVILAKQVLSLMQEHIHKIRADDHQSLHYLGVTSPLLSAVNGVMSSWGIKLLTNEEALIPKGIMKLT